METYTDYKPFINNPNYKEDRRNVLDNLEVSAIDLPLAPLVQSINRLPFVFSLQCCYGHFLWENGTEIYTLEPLKTDKLVTYRLAYIAFCIENSFSGSLLQQKLISIPSFVDQSNVQFCSAQWFWDQWPNSYALQIMPERFKDLDSAQITYAETMEIAKIRDTFFAYLGDFVTHSINQE